MFDINEITPIFNGARFSCECLCDSVDKAENIFASFLHRIRSKCADAELSHNGIIVTLDTPNEAKTRELAIILNNWIEKMPNL